MRLRHFKVSFYIQTLFLVIDIFGNIDCLDFIQIYYQLYNSIPKNHGEIFILLFPYLLFYVFFVYYMYDLK